MRPTAADLESVEYEVSVDEVAEDVEHSVLGDVAGPWQRLDGARHLLAVDEHRDAITTRVARQRLHYLQPHTQRATSSVSAAQAAGTIAYQ